MTIAPMEPLGSLADRIKLAIAEATTILHETTNSTTKTTVAQTLADLQRALQILEAKPRIPNDSK